MKWSLKQLSTVLAYLAVMPSFGAAAGDSAAIASEDSAVVKLTSATFESFMKENPLVLLEFFAPWCGHCKTLGPHFSAAADELVDKDIKLAQVDCTEERDLCQSHGIQGYPTLKVFKEESISDYKGGRTTESIVSYMTKQSLPVVVDIKTDDLLESLLEESSEPIVIQLGGSSEADNLTFHSVAKKLSEKYTFIAADKPAGKLAKSKATYVVYRPSDEQYSELPLSKSDLTSEELTLFIAAESKPYFGAIDGTTFQDYMDAKLPLAYYFYESPDELELVESTITKIAKEYRGKINFVSIDGSKFGRHAANLNMEEEFPLFVIHDIESNLKYGLALSKSLNKDISGFVKKFAKGDLEPIVKSEAVPTKEEQDLTAVYKLVGKTHDEIIKSGKKVLVKYYAPWCGHCKRLAPVYEDLLATIARDTEEGDKYIVANIDATLNDVSVDLSGYPTLILYEGDAEPVVYSGPRDLESLAAFIGYDMTRAEQFYDAPEAVEDDEEEVDGHDEL